MPTACFFGTGAPRRLREPRDGRTLSLLLPGGAISPSLASKSVAGGVPKQPPSSACSHAAALGRCRPFSRSAPPPSHFVGRPSCPSQPHVRLPPASLGFTWPALATLMATCLASAISSRTRLKSHLSPAACPEGPCRWICGFRPPLCTGTAVTDCKKVRGKKNKYRFLKLFWLGGKLWPSASFTYGAPCLLRGGQVERSQSVSQHSICGQEMQVLEEWWKLPSIRPLLVLPTIIRKVIHDPANWYRGEPAQLLLLSRTFTPA